MTERIGLLGGTFDPPHVGHMVVAGDVLQALELDRLLLVPAYLPPHKTDRDISPAEIRLEMVRAADILGVPCLVRVADNRPVTIASALDRGATGVVVPHVSCVRAAEEAVRAGVRHIQSADRPEEDFEALDVYLRSLKPVPSPHLVGDALGPAAKRGREVYVKAQCDACHRVPYYTDLRLYDLGLARGQDEARPMDTPTLVEVWRTAPFLHDGRAADLRSLFVEHNERDAHGHTGSLSEAEMQDLLAYLLSEHQRRPA